MGIEKQGAKPYGLAGKMVGWIMNKAHTPLYRKYFRKQLPEPGSVCFDIGCGGGAFLRFLDKQEKGYQLYGLDHSPEMVELCEKTNTQVINDGRLKVYISGVDPIPASSDSVDMITAFETVQFWPDTGSAFLEIYRILKPCGKFMIINHFPKEGSKWWKLAKLKSERDYRDHLNSAGFYKVDIDLKFKKGWIIVKAEKDIAMEK